MALERLTQITEVGIQSGITLQNVNVEGAYVSGVITATNLLLSGISTFQSNANFNNGVYVSGVSTLGNTVVGGATTQLIVTGNARVTGILTIGTSSITLNGANDQVNVGSATTIHTGGIQIGSSDLHSTGINIRNINASGVITATSFVGDGTNLTNTGSTLSAASGSQRVVLTGQTSGTMTASATSSSLTFNASTGALSATSFSGSGASLTGIAVTADVRTNSLAVSGNSTFAAGSAGAPSISPTGDSNTGIYFSAADNVDIATSGLQRINIDSNGRIGVNNGSQGTNPDRMYIFASSNDKYGLHIKMQNNASSGAVNEAGLRIDGYQGRGTTWRGISVDVYDIDVGTVYGTYSKATGTYGSQYAIYGEVQKDLNAYTSAFCSYSRINTTGSGGAAYFYWGDDAGTARFYVKQNGGINNYSANNVNLSDEREKKNIETLDSTWDCLKHWEIKKFHYNEDSDTDDKRYGVIAQQIAEYCPEVINDWIKQPASDAVIDADGNEIEPAKEEIVRLGVKDQQMVWMAIKALQEAQERIEQLEVQNAAITARLDAAGL
jgi:hypothetical protein